MYVCMYICIYIYICIYVCMYVCMYVWMYIICIHTYIHTYSIRLHYRRKEDAVRDLQGASKLCKAIVLAKPTPNSGAQILYDCISKIHTFC